MKASAVIGCEVLVSEEVTGVVLDNGWEADSPATVSVELAALLGVPLGIIEVDLILGLVVEASL